jgi:hypothetical protein
MNYILRKWYFDVLTGGGGYMFIYFAYMTMFGRSFRSLTFHAAMPGDIPRTRSFLLPSHEVEPDVLSHCRIRLPSGVIVVAEDQCTLDLAQGDCRVSLRYSAGGGSVGAPVRVITGRRSCILWKPVALQYIVSGEASIGDMSFDIRDADGYADVLESTCLPPLVPARTLFWGRIHAPGLAFSYSRASDRRGDPLLSGLYIQRRGYAAESGALSLFIPPGSGIASSGSAGAGIYTLDGSTPSCRIRASVRRIRPVQHSGFIDTQEIGSEMARALFRLFTRNPRSTKYISTGDITLESAGGVEDLREVLLIDETALL